jgi:hypothetical protein
MVTKYLNWKLEQVFRNIGHCEVGVHAVILNLKEFVVEYFTVPNLQFVAFTKYLICTYIHMYVHRSRCRLP